jgi:hypothetical protein
MIKYQILPAGYGFQIVESDGKVIVGFPTEASALLWLDDHYHLNARSETITRQRVDPHTHRSGSLAIGVSR